MDSRNALTIDVVIAKFVPILGALLFTTGLGYLIYTSVWASMGQTMRLSVGFFASLAIIGGAFSFSDRLRYFADITIGSGILLFYGTLIYGSRTTDVAIAAIPEVATLVTAFVFTLAVAYFASYRKSKVILALGILGAYLTPFVIGQNDVWASNISFNAYLVYFASVNIVIFLLGREIAIYDLIPLNLAGLFFGTYSLYSLSYTDAPAAMSGFFSSHTFSVTLLVVLVGMSIAGIAYSARYFTEKKEEIILSFGYLLPFFWFLLQINLFPDVSAVVRVIACACITVVYFVAWYILRPLSLGRYQHVAAYAGGIMSFLFMCSAMFPDFNIFTSLLIAYSGLAFAVIYYFDGSKGERFLASTLLTFFGAVSAFFTIYIFNSDVILYPTVFAVLALLPAILLAPLTQMQKNTPKSAIGFIRMYSMSALIIASILIIGKIIDHVDTGFAFLLLPGFLIVVWAFFQPSASANRVDMMRIGVVWMSVGFFYSFFYLLANLAPHVADDEFLVRNGGIFANWYFIKGVFALSGYLLALSISRDAQKIDTKSHPSFLLVIIGYTTLLLLVNFLIITLCNDLDLAHTVGGPRAIGTTLWWIILAIGMIFLGIRGGHIYRAEKLLGLLLLLLTIGKIGLYDLATMNMDKKIIVLMVVGGMIMMFSYFLQVKGYLKDESSK